MTRRRAFPPMRCSTALSENSSRSPTHQERRSNAAGTLKLCRRRSRRDLIAQDNPRRALTFIQDIRAKFHDILRNPMIYQLRPDIVEETRMVTVANYAILCHVMGEVVRKNA
ncbi:type II toxin-antitoxin system RelE/ParE family toxin [Propionivibrio sp.]|uniref:type II toxin-antitoxin system RelE/ParE family toxin n=1 Tax=Propionivibrio sp. TaxID=2212460 RepID=UPI00344F4F36